MGAAFALTPTYNSIMDNRVEVNTKGVSIVTQFKSVANGSTACHSGRGIVGDRAAEDLVCV